MIQIILQWYCRWILQGASFALHLKFLSWRATMMKTNVGGLDRILRILVGLVLIALAATGTVGAWGWIGIVPLATGLLGWCPAYTLLGVNTCPMKKQ
jgi:hypothetical protein